MLFAVSRFACIALAFVSSASQSNQLRVALYVGSGANNVSASDYASALSQLQSAGIVTSFDQLKGPDVAKVSLSLYELVLFPGGSGGEEASAIGAAGSAAVQAFVAGGGGYLGTCAGAYLGGTANCCEQSIPGYCSNRVGCYTSPYALQLINMGNIEPWYVDESHPISILSNNLRVQGPR
jgi:hypothetical protein